MITTDEKTNADGIGTSGDPNGCNKFVTDSELSDFGFGVHHNYIHMKPRFTSVREELLCNGKCPRSGETFMQILLKTIEKYDDVLRAYSIFVAAREHGAKHGILRNESITMKHVMAIILYTDLSEFSTLLI